MCVGPACQLHTSVSLLRLVQWVSGKEPLRQLFPWKTSPPSASAELGHYLTPSSQSENFIRIRPESRFLLHSFKPITVHRQYREQSAWSQLSDDPMWPAEPLPRTSESFSTVTNFPLSLPLWCLVISAGLLSIRYCLARAGPFETQLLSFTA